MCVYIPAIKSYLLNVSGTGLWSWNSGHGQVSGSSSRSEICWTPHWGTDERLQLFLLNPPLVETQPLLHPTVKPLLKFLTSSSVSTQLPGGRDLPICLVQLWLLSAQPEAWPEVRAGEIIVE